MGAYSGPEVNENGLVLALDAGNSKGFDDDENLISHSASTSGIVLGVIGSGGSLPTGWGIDQGQPGTTLEVVGYGIEEGLNYIDLKFSGTTSTTNRWLVRPGNGLTLTSGVTYNSSVYAKTISGTPTDVRQFSVFGGAFGASLSGINSTLTRYSGSATFGATGTYYPRLDIGYNSIGTVMNFTIRVAGFQAEVGSSASPYYPTTGTSKTRGTTLIDMTGNGNTGTLTNGPTYSSANGGSIVFDGTNDYASIAYNNSLKPVSAITMEAFCYIQNNGTSWASLIQYPQSSSSHTNPYFDWSIYLSMGSRLLHTRIDGETASSPSNVWNFNEWTHVAITFENQSVKYYVNGNNVGNSSILKTSITYDADNPVYIGANAAGGEPFEGQLGNIKVYSRALSAQEIQQNFNALRGRYGI